MGEDEKFSVTQAAIELPDMAPPKHVRGPELRSWTIGDATLRAISDGSMSLPFRVLAPREPSRDLAGLFGLDNVPARSSGELTHALIDKDGARILVDAGAGSGWQGGTGRVLRHMAANGIEPGSVTHVVLTHLHPDHAWGAIADGKLVYPNAQVFAGKTEVGFWTHPGLADRMSPAARPAVEGALRVLRGIGDRLVTVVEGDEIVPGLAVIETPGHTPGHVSLMLSDGPGLIVTGDALVNDRVSFERPDWQFGFDMDGEGAVVSRRRLLDLAAASGHLLMGYHWSWPGVGMAERQGGAFRFVPA
ncbi:MBL fold metallo-hydrolase [Rhodobacterales bacterium HKCCE3408]|nr:MBL fold metallo-hydrolase [Rhodobacterales bacterium HKCCE3408]